MRFLFSVCAHINSTVLVLGSACLLLMFAIGSAFATYLLLVRRPAVPVAILRTLAGLARMAAGSIAATVANRVWIRRLRSMDAYDKRDFCGRGIPRKDWVAFLDEMADLLWELRIGERRREP